MRTSTIIALSAAALLATGCGGDDPAGVDDTGTASASVSDNPSTTSAFRSESWSPEAAGTFSGTLNASAAVEISADGQTWIDVGSPSNISLAMQSTGSETSVASNAEIPVGTYTRVRLRLSGATANIDAGAVLGAITLSSAVAIRVGGSDQEVVIEKTVEPFVVSADVHTQIMFDLNSEAWVTAANAEDETAEDEEVEDACEADREMEPKD